MCNCTSAKFPNFRLGHLTLYAAFSFLNTLTKRASNVKRLIARQFDVARFDLGLQCGDTHPDRDHVAERGANIEIDIVAGIDGTEIDSVAVDHDPIGISG